MADGEGKTEVKTSCGFFLPKKRRFCKMIVGKGNKFCGEHSHMGGEDKVSGRKRIPCPLDPKHTVFEDQLKRHLGCCNVKKKTDVVYYQKHINSGLAGYSQTREEMIPLPQVPSEKVHNLIQRVRKCYKENCPEIEELFLSHKIFNNELTKSEYGPTALKHLKQQASLLGHLQTLGLLTSNTVYLEFGAGKGKLSHWIQQSLSDADDANFVLIDRASNRHKFDSCHKRQDKGPDFVRLNIDIEHLNLGKVSCVTCDSSKKIVVASKHLCGTATDLTIRCLFESLNQDECDTTLTDSSCQKRIKRSHPIVRGIVVALCCHHQCYWPHYIGRPFLQNLGFSAVDFHLICCLSSWATCGIRPPKADPGKKDVEKQEMNGHVKSLDLSIVEREEIGRQCKRLLDLGRLLYLESKGMKAKLCYYVDRSVSLENVVLLATDGSFTKN